MDIFTGNLGFIRLPARPGRANSPNDRPLHGLLGHRKNTKIRKPPRGGFWLFKVDALFEFFEALLKRGIGFKGWVFF